MKMHQNQSFLGTIIGHISAFLPFLYDKNWLQIGRIGGAGGAIPKIRGEMGRNAPLGAPSGIYGI